MKKLTVVIVNYNVCYFLEQALLSVRKAIDKLNAPSEIFVVDNHSADTSVEMVRRRFPEVNLIVNKRNLGFAKANNQALRLATGEYVLLLNPDTVVEEDTFLKCCLFMDEYPAAGALGVKMLDGTGDYLPESKRGLPTPEVSFYKIIGLTNLFPSSEKFARYYLGHLDKNQIHEVDVLAGAFMFLRRSVLLKVGYLDESFFMYGEDIDLSYRIKLAGYKNYYLPDTRIIHYKGESTRRGSLNYVYLFYNAMSIFYRKHFSGKMTVAYSLLIQIAIVLRGCIAVFARFFKILLPFLDDAALLFAGLYIIQMLYGQQTDFKFTQNGSAWVIPLSIVLWLGSVYFNGGYDRPFKFVSLIRGIVIGTILNAALAGFWPSFYITGGIILLGGGWALLALLGKRYIYHYGQYQNLNIGSYPRKRLAVVGSEQESKRVLGLLKQAVNGPKLVGFVSPFVTDSTAKEYLGELHQLNDIIQVHKLDELIFCGKDLSVSQIIEWMVAVNEKSLQYKILPEESEFIIGSRSKYRQGDYYTLPIELKLFKKEHARHKMLLDFFMALFFLIFSPVLVWLVKDKIGFYKNCWMVLTGNCTWVGLQTALSQQYGRNKAVLTPQDQFPENSKNANEQTIRKIEVLYAQTYSIKSDVKIILKGFKFLGRSI